MSLWRLFEGDCGGVGSDCGGVGSNCGGVEGDCGGVNPLRQSGGQFTSDAVHEDDFFDEAPGPSTTYFNIMAPCLLDQQLNSSAPYSVIYPNFFEESFIVLDENYDSYKEYKFAKKNPKKDLENALESGKEYFKNSDLPSAVFCFEAAASKDPDNAEAWELLGISQAENEMNLQGIAALKKSLDLRPENLKVLMALAVCYTNESLQSEAVKMLTNWLQQHPKYKHLVPSQPDTSADATASLASSLITSNKLLEVKNMFLDAVLMNPQTVDPEVQDALGILYNLCSEYGKAADCFETALHNNPNAKIWNRLGTSLANDARYAEAYIAYHRALELEPGFKRALHNSSLFYNSKGGFRKM